MIESSVTINKTDTLKVKWAALPMTSVALELLVEFLEPIHMVPQVVKVASVVTLLKKEGHPDAYESCISAAILQKWRELSNPEVLDVNTFDEETRWLYELDKVELIECDLLVPKGAT